MDELIIGLISILLVIAGMAIYYFIFIRDKKSGIDIPQQKNIPPMPPIKEYGRRCSECNWPLKDAHIYLVRDDDRIGGITAALTGSQEGELKEAIDCPICGHQNIIGKFYRPLDPENVKTINDIRRAAGFEPVETLKPYDVTFKATIKPESLKMLNDYDEMINRIVDGAQEDDNGQQ